MENNFIIGQRPAFIDVAGCYAEQGLRPNLISIKNNIFNISSSDLKKTNAFIIVSARGRLNYDVARCYAERGASNYAEMESILQVEIIRTKWKTIS